MMPMVISAARAGPPSAESTRGLAAAAPRNLRRESSCLLINDPRSPMPEWQLSDGNSAPGRRREAILADALEFAAGDRLNFALRLVCNRTIIQQNGGSPGRGRGSPHHAPGV